MKTYLFLIFVSISVFGYKVINNEVTSTTIKYILLDISLEDKHYDLMLGSSTIKRLNKNKYLVCGTWLNRGIGSSTISNLNTYIEMTNLEITPAKILLYAGENDISRGMGVGEAIDSYKKLIQKLLDKYPGSDIHAVAIKPSPNRREHWEDFAAFNNAVDLYAGKLNGLYFHRQSKGQPDYSPASFIGDGIHLSNVGYNTFTSGFNKTCKIK